MVLTHRIIKRVDLPHEEGQWIEVRMPSLDILERAAQARSKKAVALMTMIDLKQLQDLSPSPAQDNSPSYDAITLLQSCIVAWSYEDPVTPENVAELDATTVDYVVSVLIPQESETERKNAFGGSTMLSTVKDRPRKSG